MELKSLLNFDYGLLAVYFCGLHRILFKINSPYGKAKFGSVLFGCALRSFFPLTCFPSIPVAITVILHFFLCSLRIALLAKAIALAAIACRNFLNYCTLFIAGASPILLPLPSPALLISPFPFGMVFVVSLSSCSCHTTCRMEIRHSTYCQGPYTNSA